MSSRKEMQEDLLEFGAEIAATGMKQVTESYETGHPELFSQGIYNVLAGARIVQHSRDLADILYLLAGGGMKYELV